MMYHVFIIIIIRSPIFIFVRILLIIFYVIVYVTRSCHRPPCPLEAGLMTLQVRSAPKQAALSSVTGGRRLGVLFAPHLLLLSHFPPPPLYLPFPSPLNPSLHLSFHPPPLPPLSPRFIFLPSRVSSTSLPPPPQTAHLVNAPLSPCLPSPSLASPPECQTVAYRAGLQRKDDRLPPRVIGHGTSSGLLDLLF